MQTQEVLQSIKQLRGRVQSSKRYGIADVEAVHARVPDEVTRLRKTLPRTKAVSQQALEAQARAKLLEAVKETLRKGAQAQRRELGNAIGRARADLDRARAAARSFAPSVELSFDELNGARPIEIATLRELRSMRLRSDADDARRRFSVLDVESQVSELERAAGEVGAIRTRFSSEKATAKEHLHNASKEPEAWREGSVSLAKKALAIIEADEASALAPAQLSLHVLQGLVKEGLSNEIVPPTGERDPAKYVQKAQHARDSRRGRLRDAETRLMSPEQLQAEAEAEEILREIDQEWERARIFLGLVIEHGMPGPDVSLRKSDAERRETALNA